MDTATILDLVKARSGISTDVRDTYLLAIIEGIITELEGEKGIVLDNENQNHLMFVVDYSVWRYQSRDSTGDMPKHLHWRLRNLYLNSGGKNV